MAIVARTLGDNLAWVRGALDEHLSQVRNLIQRHVQEGDETDSLRPALLQMQQLHGVLGMIQCYGPLMLVEEMSHALERLIKNDVPERDIALVALLGGTLQLSDYLDLLRSGEQDGALVFHPVINELRMATGRSVVSERALFVEYFQGAATQTAGAPLAERAGIAPAAAGRLARVYEDALLRWLKEGKTESLERLVKVATEVEQTARNPQLALSWNALAEVLEALREERLKASLDLNRLLGLMGQCLSRLSEYDEMDSAIELGDLPNSLLYYVERSEPKSQKARQLCDEYGLDAILPEEKTLKRLRDALHGPNTELLDHLSSALKEDLSSIKDSLDIMERSSGVHYEGGDEMLEACQRIADTLHMLGMGDFKQVMQQQILRLEELMKVGGQSSGAWMEVATSLLYLEQGLDEALFRQLVTREVKAGGAEDHPGDGPNFDFEAGMKALLQEISVNIARLQEFVRSYLNDGEIVVLTEASRLLEEIQAGLNVIGYTKTAEIAGRLRQFLNGEGRRVRQDRDLADKMAEAVAAFEFYLQAQKAGRAQAPLLLEQVTSALDKLQAGEAKNEDEAIIASEPKPGATAEDFRAEEDDVDPEIREIFLEEAQEVVKDLKSRLPRWIDEPVVDENFAAIRRGFHTLKGSGRMVNAREIGEFAWALENLLNRCLEGALPVTDEIVATLEEAVEALPPLLDNFSSNTDSGQASAALTARACELAQVKAAEQEQPPESSGGAGGEEPAAALETELADAAERKDRIAAQDDDESELELRQVFLSDAYRRVGILSDYLEGGGETGAGLADVQRAMHVLRGSAEATNMEGLARLAQSLEDLVQSVCNLPYPSTEALKKLLREAATALLDAVREAEEPANTAPTNRNALVGRIRAYQTRLMQDSLPQNAGPETMEAFTDEAIGYVERIERRLNAWFDSRGDSNQLEAARDSLSILSDTARDASARAMLDVARALERWAGRAQAQGVSPWETARRVISSVVDEMYIILDRYRAGETGFSAETLRARLDDLAPPAPPVEPDPDTTRRAVEETRREPEHTDAQTPTAGFDPEVLEIFSEEASELLETITHHLQKGREGDAASLNQLKRALHTLKGSARMAGVGVLGDLSHHMETLVESIQSQGEEKNAAVLEQIDAGVERMHAMVDTIARGEMVDKPGRDTDSGEPQAVEELEESGGQPVEAPAPDTGEAVAEVEAEQDEARAGTSKTTSTGWAPALFEFEQGKDTGEPLSFGDHARVAVSKLRRMLDDAGEINIYRSRLEEQTGTLQNQLNEMQRTIERGRALLHNLELETEATIMARHRGESGDGDANQHDKAFDPLEMDRYTRIQELSRSLGESVTDLESLHDLMNQASSEEGSLLLQQGRVNASLQEGLMGTLLVPFDRQVPRLKRLVSQCCEESGKSAKILFEGADIEMDRTVLERMTAPIEHILRNAVIHGLEESGEEREAGDKVRQGTITVSLRREAAQLQVVITDDGKGLDLRAIRRQAEERGLLAPGKKVGDAELANFILQPGFTTAESLTQGAGRGVGMDVASASIRHLGGALNVHTKTGLGARFSIRLPVSLALSQTLLTRVGEDFYAFPLSGIQGITRVPSKTLVGFFNGTPTGVNYGDQEYSLRYLGDFVGVGRPQAQELPKHVPVLAINTGARCIGLVPDAIVNSQEVVVKSVGPTVSTVHGITGATVMSDGNVVLIFDPEELLLSDTRDVALHDKAPRLRERQMEGARGEALVLVVDDSITIRRVTERLLVRNGLRAATARDGMDALAKLQAETPDLVLLDIEMPRIDGFEVASYMRNNSELSAVPIVMITSRSGEKHRKHARKMGVDRFLTKPYQEEALLGELKALLPDQFAGESA